MKTNYSHKKKIFGNHSVFDRELQRWKKQTIWKTDNFLSSPHYKAETVLESLIFASMTNNSLNTTCSILKQTDQECPSEETLLRIFREQDPETMETYLNQVLQDQYHDLPAKTRRVFQRKGMVIIDFHTDPYYGSETTPLIVKGQCKHSTTKAFSYLTADVVSRRFSQTIAVLFRRPQTSVATLVGDLIASIELFFTPKLILMDGEFPSVELCRLLIEKGISFIARKSITKRIRQELQQENKDVKSLLVGFQPVTYQSQKASDFITLSTTVYYLYQQLKALVMSPDLNFTPAQAKQLYSERFGIETGYRDKHFFQAPTCSRSASVRLVLVIMACLLWNIWQLFRGLSRRVDFHPIARKYLWRHRIAVIRFFWLVQMVKRWFLGR